MRFIVILVTGRLLEVAVIFGFMTSQIQNINRMRMLEVHTLIRSIKMETKPHIPSLVELPLTLGLRSTNGNYLQSNGTE